MSNDHILANLCNRNDTLRAATSTLARAQIKTGPGSGYDLGPFKVGIAAVCAYIASEQLQNDDVKRPVAQAASCLKSKDFEKCYNMIKNATASGRRSQTTNFYESLIESSEITIPPHIVKSWISKAEADLKVLHKDRFDTFSEAEKKAVFLWVYNLVQSLKDRKLPPVERLAGKLKANIKIMMPIHVSLNNSRSSVSDLICEEIAQLRNGVTPSRFVLTSSASPRKSPTKQPLRAIPTRKSPTKRPIRELPSRDSPQKRKVMTVTSTDVEMQPPQTPMKKQKIDPTPSSSRVIHVTPRTHVLPIFPINKAATRASSVPQIVPIPEQEYEFNADVMDVDEDVDDAEMKGPRRSRPVFDDQLQWMQMDSRLETVWKRAEEHKRKMITRCGSHPLEKYRAGIIV